MRQLLLSLSLVLSESLVVVAQETPCESYYDLDFDYSYCLDNLILDTISDTNNIWAVGNPQKSVFTEARSLPKAILTDTINPYPVNDTSSFVIMNTTMGGGFVWPHTVILAGHYQVNTDSLNDFGAIEFSPNNGITWIDLINDTVYDEYYEWWTEKPILTGSSDGWVEFAVWLAPLGPIFNITENDTVLYKFTFISDSIYDGLDGLMFDDFHYEDWVEGIEEFAQVQSKVYPNPANQSATIEFDNPEFSTFRLTVSDALGRLIYTRQLPRQTANLATDKFPDGVYYYSLTSTERSERAWGMFVVKKE